MRRYLATPLPEPRKRKRPRPVLEQVRPRLEQLVEEWPERTTAKQRITGRRLQRALREEGYEVGLTLVLEYLREWRRTRAEVYVPLVHRPGESAQAVEDARGYFLLLEEIVRRCGIPLALYSDRHGVFKASSDDRRGVQVSTQFARAMRELGITQIFARSPQAKGRVERAAGTFQDRLVTELSDASASTIAEAQTVLERFLLRFNARFRVPAAEPAVAYRPLDRALPLASILSFRHPRSVARDNTVKYRWRTLQLLPGPERTSYAGARVEVLERPGGELSVLHQGETIAAREAPPRAGVLRAARSELARRPDHERIASGLGSGGAPRRLPVAPAVPAVEGAPNGAAVKPEPGSKQLRAPTPRQLARWKAIQQAQLQGLSMRATARLLGISRVTVRSYVRANGVPGRRNAVAAR